MFARLFLLFFLGICFAQNAPIVLAATGINDQISFQGKVVNTNGTNVANGSYDFVFKLYTVSSAGTAVWTETWNSGTSQVTVTDGIFQVNLGTHTDLPGSIDFNTDNIYLGIEFNGDGEMSPRVHFTAAPYAFNAMKVAGLTVTDTTGTLTIPNGETISFGGSFTTTASNDVTLTTSGATNVTLPTTGTLATLAGSEILTNKTIGSTGLTFSGATTDITTASGEDLTVTAAGAGVIVLSDSVTSGALTISGVTTDITTGTNESLVVVANGAGVIDLQDATTADSLTLDSGGLTLQNSEGIGNGTDDLITFVGAGGADNTDLYLDLDGTSPVLYSNTDNRVSVEDYLNVQVSGVTGAAAGDIWYDSAANKFKVNESGTTKILCNTTDLGCGSGGASDLQTTYGTDADGSNATISLTTADDSLVFTNPSSSGTDSAFVLQVSQQNTTAAVAVLDLSQSSNAANAVNLTANSIDTETGLAITTNGLTSGSGFSLTSSAASNFTGSLASINLSDGTGASSNTGSLLTLTNSGTANANTSLVIQHNATGTGNLAFRVNDVAGDTTPFVIDGAGNVGIGDLTPDATFDVDFSSANGTAGTEYGAFITVSDTGAVSTGTDTTYGNQTNVTRSGATGGTLNTYGQYVDVTATFASGAGSSSAYGVFGSATGNTTGNTFSYGVWGQASQTDTAAGGYFSSTGATTGYGIQVFTTDGGGATTTAYGANLQVSSDGSITTAYGNRILVSESLGSITTGYGLYIENVGASTDYAIYQVSSNDDNILFGSTNIGGDTTPNTLFTVGNTSQFQVNSTGAIVAATGVTSSGTITFSGIANDGAEATALLINGSNQVVSRELGSNAFTSTTYADTALSNLSSVAINTSLLPGTDDSIDLGDNTHRFRDLYLGGETLHIGTSTTDEATVSYTTATNLLNFSTDSTSNGDIAFFSDDLYLDKSVGFIGINDVTPDFLLDIETTSATAALSISRTTGQNGNITLGPSGVTLYPESAGNVLTIANTNNDGGTALQLVTEAGSSSGGVLNLTGYDLNTDADGTVSTLNAGTFVSKNDSNTRAFTILQIKPDIATGVSNANTTLNLLNIDTTNSSTTGVTTNLIKASYGGSQKFLVDSNGAGTFASSLTVQGSSLTASSATTITLGSTGADTITLGNGGADTITIGNAASTGVSIVDNNWSVTTAGVGTFITGTVIGSQTFTTNNIADSGALTITSGSGTALTLNSGTTGTINIGTDASAETINIGNTGAAAKIIAIGNNTQANTITIGDSSVTSLSITENNWSISTTGAASFASATISGTLAANGGITFDAATDTVGAFTAAGTIDMNTNILTNIGNSGTDFVASTGALTLAGVLTANGGITLASSQTFTASSLSYMDLGAITHGTTAVQGLRLPQAASASPSSPTSGEGYLAWDAGGNQVIYYNGSAWATFGAGGGYATIKDESTSLTQRTTLAFLGAGVSCADNVTQTECTISGGSGSDLQGTYGADADGSNATISLTSADDGLVFTNPTSAGTDSAFLLQLTQQNTTAAVTVLDMTQSSNAANAMNLTANSIDTETGLAITTNGLTSGKGIQITSSSTTFTGNLADVSLTGSNAANTGNVLAVSNTGTANANTTLFVDHRATGTGNLAMRVNDEVSDTTPFIIDGNGAVGIGTSSIAANGSTATGERLLQVGSGTNRGDVAIYGELTNEGYKQALGISGIIDVFIYDTTRDSDAGRWRMDENTSFKSWYTETKDDGIGDACAPATDDRCGTSAFPAKAVLATTADALYIFDAKDNSMFMKFSQNASGYALGVDTNNNPTGVFGLNGTIYVGTNGASAGGLYAFDFPNDRLYNYNTTDRDMGNQNIANRNSAVTYNVGSITAFAIANNAVNDVHGAVITGSGAVAANNGTTTGKTFIVAATDSSASLIDLSGSKVFEFGDTTTDDINQVWLTSRARLYLTNETLAQVELYTAVDQDVADQATPDDIYDEQAANTPNLSKTAPTISTSPDALQVLERESAADANYALALGTVSTLPNGDVLYVGHSLGLTEIHTAGAPSTAIIGWSKFYTTTTETAYMSGTPRAMFTMDDASGDVTDASIRNSVLEAKNTPTYGVDGVRGLAMSFNGTNQYLCSDANNDATCDQDTDFDAGTLGFTIEAWFKKSAISGTDTLIDHTYTTTPALAAGWRIWMNSSGQIQAGIDDDATAFDDDIIAGAGPSLADGQWHHVVFTRASTAFAAPNPPVAVGIYLFVDGKLMGSDTTIAATATLTAATILGIGADCSVGAACSTGANFWDGQIDDVYISMNGATTSDTLNAAGGAIARRYSEGKAALLRPSTRITDATTTSANTIGDSGAAYIGNEFVGQIIEITGGTGAGQTRRIVSNTSTTFTVSPDWTVTPDTTSDYEVMPEQLYGSSNSVTAIAITETDPLRTSRTLYVGTNSGGDGGGISVFSGGAGHPSVSAVYHADAAYEADDGTDWTGSGYDDIRSIDVRSGVLAMGSAGNIWEVRTDRNLEQSIDLLTNALNGVRQELMADTLQANSINPGGADLAENYYSDVFLAPGTVVALDPKREAYVQETTSAYDRSLLGVVATNPGIVLGDASTNGYPVALVGRVPVKVTMEGGQIRAGDPITSASRSGFGMRANQAGRILGTALTDAGDWTICDESNVLNQNAELCTTVMVFVNLSHYYGQSVELAMIDKTKSVGLTTPEVTDETGLGADGAVVKLVTTEATREERIMQFLKEVRDEKARYTDQSSEVFTDRVAASTEIITPKLVVDEIFAKSIKADSIEGLSLWTDRIASLQAKYAGLVPETRNTDANPVEAVLGTERTLLNLEQFVVGMFTTRLDASILGKLSVTGALTVADAAEFQGETTFARLATFMNGALFRGKVAFEKTPTFSADTAGFATITEGEKRVRITFDEAYARQPIVAVTLTRDISPLLEDSADDTLRSDVAEVEREYVKGVFDADIRYIVTEKDQTGFTILLSDKAPAELSFSWVAIAVDRPRTSISQPEKEGEDGKSDGEDGIVLPETPVTPAGEVAPSTEPIVSPVEETPILTPTEESVVATPEAETI